MYYYPWYPYVYEDPYMERQFSSLPGSFFPGAPGFPGVGPGFPGAPDFPGQGGSQASQAPTAPPPAFIPQQATASTFAVDPGSIRFCLFRNTYIWLSNGQSFWYYPIFVGSTSVTGFRWNGRSWMIFGIDTRRIVSFTCF